MEIELRTEGRRKENALRVRRLGADTASTHITLVEDGTGSAMAGSGNGAAVESVYLITMIS